MLPSVTVKFFILQAGTSTDSRSVMIELYLILLFDPCSTDGIVLMQNNFFSVKHLRRGTAKGLLVSLKCIAV